MDKKILLLYTTSRTFASVYIEQQVYLFCFHKHHNKIVLQARIFFQCKFTQIGMHISFALKNIMNLS